MVDKFWADECNYNEFNGNISLYDSITCGLNYNGYSYEFRDNKLAVVYSEFISKFINYMQNNLEQEVFSQFEDFQQRIGVMFDTALYKIMNYQLGSVKEFLEALTDQLYFILQGIADGTDSVDNYVDPPIIISLLK